MVPLELRSAGCKRWLVSTGEQQRQTSRLVDIEQDHGCDVDQARDLNGHTSKICRRSPLKARPAFSLADPYYTLLRSPLTAIGRIESKRLSIAF